MFVESKWIWRNKVDAESKKENEEKMKVSKGTPVLKNPVPINLLTLPATEVSFKSPRLVASKLPARDWR